MGKLTLSRKRGEKIEISLQDQTVTVEVVTLRDGKIGLKFDADSSVKIDRYEVAQAKRRAA